MQVTETTAAGLKREYRVVVPATDLEARVNERLDDLKGRVQLRGFRPGKVPVEHLRRLYGKAAMAEVIEAVGKLVANLIVHDLGNANSVRLGQGFQPGRYVDPIAENVVRLDDHIAEVDADSKADAIIFRDIGIAMGHAVLDCNGAQNGVDHAGNLDNHAVAGRFDDPAMVLIDPRLKDLAAVRLKAFVRAFLIEPH